MQITQRFTVDFPRPTVWAYFGRLADVTRCMPGAALAEPPTGNKAKFTLAVKLGPISAAFAGDCEVERDDASQHGVIRGNARDTRGDSRVKGQVDYALAEEGGGAKTAVDVKVEFALTGRLAHDDLAAYNAIQKLLYVGVILAGVVLLAAAGSFTQATRPWLTSSGASDWPCRPWRIKTSSRSCQLKSRLIMRTG